MSTSSEHPTPEEVIRARAALFRLEGELFLLKGELWRLDGEQRLSAGRAELQKYIAVAEAAGITDEHPLVKALMKHWPEPPKIPELPELLQHLPEPPELSELPKLNIPFISQPSP
ncbi:hypothetical protein [Comamonas odontotermitis]|uniref:hypothetical protein n=1 Tax=Comamonas odontotermitis TaxID=379895 RepID=UPI001CC74BC7|nr:hypothetical protein [Comamonas odontotermitis]UBB15403.1 hypothetical protein LAD35_11010 [Comamonas odontotermitis]